MYNLNNTILIFIYRKLHGVVIMESTINVKSDINMLSKDVEEIIEEHRLSHLVGVKIDSFNKNFLKQLLIFEKEGMQINEKYYYRIAELSDIAYNKIHIQNNNDFKKIEAAISMSERISSKGFENRDFECFITSLYNLKTRLKMFY